jgi:ribosomal-protein-alanine N-acetyltransferase
MTAGDIAAVAVVEAEFSSLWTAQQISAEYKRESTCTLVAESTSHEIVGWCCGFCLAPDAELFKISVSSTWQKQGVATSLLLELCLFFVDTGGERVFLEVRSKNVAALGLYVKSGWEKQGIRKNYYKNPVDDAILLVRSLKEWQE